MRLLSIDSCMKLFVFLGSLLWSEYNIHKHKHLYAYIINFSYLSHCMAVQFYYFRVNLLYVRTMYGNFSINNCLQGQSCNVHSMDELNRFIIELPEPAVAKEVLTAMRYAIVFFLLLYTLVCKQLHRKERGTNSHGRTAYSLLTAKIKMK